MSIFSRRFIEIISVFFFFMMMASVVVTLLLVDDIQQGRVVPESKVLFVQVTNIIYATVIGLGLFLTFIGAPIVFYYQRKTQLAIDTGLRQSGPS